MCFQSQLNEEVVEYVVLEHKLHVTPAVLIIAGVGEIVWIENTAVQRRAGLIHFCCSLPFIPGLLAGIRLEVLNRIKDIEAYVDTCGQMPDDELGLETDTHAEAVLEVARSSCRNR